MSRALLIDQIERFLASSQPGVICISGGWGIGKTHAWNEALKKSKREGSLFFHEYAYVSLFGVDSISQLREAIFTTTRDLSTRSEVSPYLDMIKNTGRSGSAYLKQIPKLREYFGDIGSPWLYFMRKQTICFDDLERRGKGLAMREVLGLASQLSTEKECKIALILNDAETIEKEDFEAFLEKVVDVHFRFEPEAAQSTAIAFEGPAAEPMIQKAAVDLHIVNIRIIRKAIRAYNQLARILEDMHPNVREYVALRITLTAYIAFAPDGAGFLEYINERAKHIISGTGATKVVNPKESEVEARWNDALVATNVEVLDATDLSILKGVRNGYFDLKVIRGYLSDKNAVEMQAEQRKVFQEAWDCFHDSFNSNEEELAEKMLLAIRSVPNVISPGNLNSTISLLKALGRRDDAISALEGYVAARTEPATFFDLSTDPFTKDFDSDVAAAFQRKLLTFSNGRTLRSVLLDLGLRNGWNPEDLALAAASSTQEYKELFISLRGKMLQTCVTGALQFRMMSPKTDDMTRIIGHAEQALREIAATSALNRRRIAKFGLFSSDPDA